jgi:hypothetical protein
MEHSPLLLQAFLGGARQAVSPPFPVPSGLALDVRRHLEAIVRRLQSLFGHHWAPAALCLRGNTSPMSSKDHNHHAISYFCYLSSIKYYICIYM